MKKARINGVVVNFDLSATSTESYDNFGRELTYLGEGTFVSNIKGQELSRPELKHFWKFN